MEASLDTTKKNNFVHYSIERAEKGFKNNLFSFFQQFFRGEIFEI